MYPSSSVIPKPTKNIQLLQQGITTNQGKGIATRTRRP